MGVWDNILIASALKRYMQFCPDWIILTTTTLTLELFKMYRLIPAFDSQTEEFWEFSQHDHPYERNLTMRDIQQQLEENIFIIILLVSLIDHWI